MEVSLLNSTTLRLKGKSIVLIVDPVAQKAKIAGDAVIFLREENKEIDVEGSRLNIFGSGDYEVGGVKITGIKSGDILSYYVLLDGMSLLIGKASGIKGKESLRDVDVVIILSDIIVDQSSLASVTSGVAIFYGEMGKENITALGKDLQSVNKFSITKDKLPSEMEVVWLA